MSFTLLNCSSVDEIQFVKMNTLTHDSKSKLYHLWHQQFAHLKEVKMQNLHRVMTLSKSIFIVKKDGHVCEVCTLMKLRNQKNHTVSKRRAFILTFIFIDICNSLFLSYTDYSYFLKIVNNYLRKIWTISLKWHTEIQEILQKWQLRTELQSESKMLAVHSDKITELKNILNTWCVIIDIVSQYTVSHWSIQNDVTKWAILTIKNNV